MAVLVAFDPCRGSGQRGSVMHVNDSGQRVNTTSKARPVWHLSMVRVTHMCALEKLEPCPDSLPAPCTHWPNVARLTSSSSSKLFCPPLPLLLLQQQPQQRQPHAASASASASAVGAWDGVVSAG